MNRTVFVTSGLAAVVRDVRYGLRVLARRPGPTLLAAGTISLGVAAVSLMASLAWSILLKPLPWPDSHRLVRVTETRQGGTARFGPLMTNATWYAWREAAQTIDGIGAWRNDKATLGPTTPSTAAERVALAQVTAGLLPLLGVHPEHGRAFTTADETAGAPRVALISHAAWQDRFAAAADVVGRTVRLDGEPYTVVGVMPDGFYFPDRRAVLWTPLHVPPVVTPGGDGRQLSMFNALARLRPGVTTEQAAAEATARGRTAPDPGFVSVAVFGSRGPVVVSVEPALDAMTREVRPGLLVLVAAVVLLLVCSVANVANLQLARATGRRREMGIRAALGAGSGRLVQQLIVEHLLLGLAGGIAGIVLARAGLALVPRLVPATLPRLDELAFDWPATLVALVAALGAGIVAGALPAWQVRRLDLVETLAEDGLAPSGGGLRLRTTRVRAAVLVAQVAAAAVLLVGGALLTRTFLALARQDRGFDVTHVLTATVPLPDVGYTPARRTMLLEAVAERLREVPGVQAAGFTNILPLTGSESIRAFTMRARRGAPDPMVSVQTAFRVVSPGYFTALGLRLVEGRALNDGDTATSRHAVVVTRAFARAYLDSPAIGALIPAGTDETADWEVVGVVDNVRGAGGQESGPEVLVSYRQWPEGVHGDPALAVRSAGDPSELAPVMRGILRDLDPDLALGDIRTMEDRVRELVATPRLYSMVVGGFAVLALVIAGVGLFGVLSYAVAQRSRELAVRAALGAAPRRLIALVVGQGLGLTVVGIAIGFAAVAMLGSGMSALLYGVSPQDPWTFLAVAVLLLSVAAVACLVPAARAARVSPMALLRRG